MKITWTVSDGYVNDGPHSTLIQDADLKECDTVDDAMNLIHEAVEEDFRGKATYGFKESEVRAEVEKLLAK